MGQLKKFITQVLGFDGWRVTDWYWETADGVRFVPISRQFVRGDARLHVVLERKWMGCCSGCGTRCRKVHERTQVRCWRDEPWCGHPVLLEAAPVRLWCRRCRSAQIELLPWADRYQRETRRLQHRIALEAQSMPVSHVSVMHGLGWHTVRRAEREALRRWLAAREPAPLRMVGVDEKYLGRRNSFEDKFVTIISNLETGEPIWVGFGASQATLERWIATLSLSEKEAIQLFALDMSPAYIQTLRTAPNLGHAALVHDPFHVMKRVLRAVDETRRDVFFRAGKESRALGRGSRWLLLRAWERTSPDAQTRLLGLLSLNKLLARTYIIKEQMRLVLRAPDRASMASGLQNILRRTQAKKHRHLRSLHESLIHHRDAILALGQFRPPTGRIEALNNNWETLVRQARGYRDLDHLLLKLRFAAINPLRTDDGVRRFLALGVPTPYHKAA